MHAHTPHSSFGKWIRADLGVRAFQGLGKNSPTGEQVVRRVTRDLRTKHILEDLTCDFHLQVPLHRKCLPAWGKLDFLQTLLFGRIRSLSSKDRPPPLLVLQYFGSPCHAKKNHLQNFGSQAQLGRSSPNNSPPRLCKKLQNFGSQALLVRTCYGHLKKNGRMLGAKPCLSDPANSLFMPCCCNILGAQPSLAEYKNKILGEKKTLTKQIQFFGKLEALLREN